MSKNLVIVESPTKAKVLTKFLGKDYVVKSSFGHIRDLPNKKSDLPIAKRKLKWASMAVDTENNFEPMYVTSAAGKKRLADIKKDFKENTVLWIATDEDREGEAIGWHLVEVLKPKKTNKVNRIVFHEITKEAIIDSIKKPREIDIKLVDAQKARRILDRLVGWELSPVLWKKIRFGLSAGRVQSVTVRLIVDREREIKAFNAEEYWSIVSQFEKDSISFTAQFQKLNDKKFVPKNKDEAEAILSAVKGQDFLAKELTEKTTKRQPAAPFTTSTLQQEAARKGGFSVKKTMMVAQRLYEGAATGSGLITYMRTDSVNLSQKALTDAKVVIEKDFGKEYALNEPRIYKTKSKSAQEAHEAIRPTEISVRPDDVKNQLSEDEFKLYSLIWKRTVATQMAEANLKNTSVDFEVEGKNGNKNKHIFRATGQQVVFPGFLKLYIEGDDNEEAPEDAKPKDFEKLLPTLEKGEILNAKKIEKKQHFTKPPARYTEASLVKKLEEEGIGRPSTYAPIISTVQARGYVEKEGPQLKPTDTAFVVTDLLIAHFEKIVDLTFTAKMEDDLDEIADGKKECLKFLDDFYWPFRDLVVKKSDEIKKTDIVNEESDEVCEKCGKKMMIKLSRFGKFLSCSGYPECKEAKPLEQSEEQKKELEILQKEFENEVCEKCAKKMIVKTGRFGNFLACEDYPKCKTTKPILKTIGMKCPDCKKGDVVEKRTRKGKIFWGCEKYPKCEFSSWDDPRKAK